MQLNSCDDQLDSFQRVVHNAMDSYIPLRTVKQYPNDKSWITIRESIKKRQQAWLNNDLPVCKAYRNKVIKICKKACQILQRQN